MRRTYDYVVACNSRKGEISQMEVVEDFESRQHKAVSLWLKEKRRYRNGLNRSCRRCSLATVEEGKKYKSKRQRRMGRTTRTVE